MMNTSRIDSFLLMGIEVNYVWDIRHSLFVAFFCGERFDCNQVSVAIYSLMIILLLNLCADCSIVFFMIGNYVH